MLQENECFRLAIEPMLLKYNVDIMFFGHMHAYERTRAMANWRVSGDAHDPCMHEMHITSAWFAWGLQEIVDLKQQGCIAATYVWI